MLRSSTAEDSYQEPGGSSFVQAPFGEGECDWWPQSRVELQRVYLEVHEQVMFMLEDTPPVAIGRPSAWSRRQQHTSMLPCRSSGHLPIALRRWRLGANIVRGRA